MAAAASDVMCRSSRTPSCFVVVSIRSLSFVVACICALLTAVLVCLDCSVHAGDVSMPQRKGIQEISLHFFMHDDLLTANPTAVAVVPPVAGFNGTLEGQSFFGAVVVFDDPITAGPERDSLELGRGRGTYIFSSLLDSAPAVEFVWTAVFNDASGYGGSTLSYQGQDAILDPVREIAITGGTGTFRFAQGYAVITTFESVGAAVNLEITSVVRYTDF